MQLPLPPRTNFYGHHLRTRLLTTLVAAAPDQVQDREPVWLLRFIWSQLSPRNFFRQKRLRRLPLANSVAHRSFGGYYVVLIQ